MEEENKAKGNAALRIPFIIAVMMMFAFFVFDLSMTYFVVGQTLVPVVNLLPLLQLTLV